MRVSSVSREKIDRNSESRPIFYPQPPEVEAVDRGRNVMSNRRRVGG
jgi:hypothetical protein